MAMEWMMEQLQAPMLLFTNSMAAALLALIAMVTLVAVRHLLSSSWRSPRLPPSPPWRLPVIGHLHLLRPPVHRTLHKLAARLGAPLMHVRLGSTHCVVVSSAGAARELIHGHDAAVSGRPITALARTFSYGSAGFAFTPYGKQWRFLRRLCVSEVLAPRVVEQLRGVRRASLVPLLRAVMASAARGEDVDLTRELIRFSNASIVRMVASDDDMGVADEAQELGKSVTALLGAFNVEDYVPLCRGWDLQGLRRKAVGVHRRFDAVLEQMIRHKEAAREHGRRRRGAVVTVTPQEDKKAETPAAATRERSKDLLDILLDEAENETAEVKLTRENMKAFITDVVTAGSDSSAATVEWMLAELMNHPEAMRKVRDEIVAVVGGDRIVGEADLPRLPYLQAAFKETLRLHPGAPIAHRESTREVAVGGFTLPPRTAVFINLWAIGRDASVWEEPLAFRPERFLPSGAAEGLEPRGQHFQFIPFGSGRRGCPGMGLAQQSVPAVLAALVQCFDWAAAGAVAGGGQTAVVDMDESDVGLVCARKHPLLLRPTARLNPFPAVV